jgi:hypothetical protein
MVVANVGSLPILPINQPKAGHVALDLMSAPLDTPTFK